MSVWRISKVKVLDFFDKLVSKFSPDLGVDLGSYALGVVECGKSSWREPTRLVYDLKTDKPTAIGEEAKRREGRLGKNKLMKIPIKEGRVCSYDSALELLCFCLSRCSQLGLFGPRILLSVPVGTAEADVRIVSDLCRSAGARGVSVVSAPLASALGAGLSVTQSKACMVVNIGADLTQAAVMCMGAIVSAESIPVAGFSFDKAIVDYCRDQNLVVGFNSAEALKISGGCAFTEKGSCIFEIKGRDLKTGYPRKMEITSAEILQIFRPKLEQIARMVQRVAQLTPPGFAGDILKTGIMLCGGGCQLSGLSGYLSEKTGFFCQAAEKPEECTLLGLEQLYHDPRIMRSVENAETHNFW
ncbi:MAG: rod shape-determining protein [Candidatus Bruticola sp.]